jgi:hypothetical protein
MEEYFYDSPTLCRFVGVDLDLAAAFDETTIMRRYGPQALQSSLG